MTRAGLKEILGATRTCSLVDVSRGRVVLERRRAELAEQERARRDSPETWRARARAALVVLAALMVLYPAAVDSYWTFVGTTALVTAITALSFVVLVGLAGLPSFVQATFMGIGAYTTFNLEKADVGFPWTVLLSGLIVMVPAIIVALPSLRLRGVSLGILTLAAAVVADRLVFQWRWFTGVLSGASVPPAQLGPLHLGSDTAQYGVAAIVFVLCLLFVWRITRGSTGRAFLALQGSEPGAVAAGLNPDLLKLEAFAIGGFLAGVGGSLFAYGLGSLSVVSFNFVVSLNLMVVAVVGGVYHPLGALAAGVVYAFGPALLREANLDPNLAFLLTGAGLVVALIAGRGGIAQWVGSALRARSRPAILRPPSAGAVPATATRPAGQPQLDATPSDSVLELRGLGKRFGGVQAVSDVSLRIPQGQLAALIGPNGAGKSTLFRLINGMVAPDTGDVFLHGRSLLALSSTARARRGLGWTYQSTQLFPSLTTVENLLVPLEQHRPGDVAGDVLSRPKSRHRRGELVERAYLALDEAGLGRQANELVGNLPFGVLRRLEVARAVVSDPAILLLDEPATGMNVGETEDFAEFLRSIWARHHITIFFIEHDMNLVMPVAHQVFVLDFGQLIASGTPAEIQNNQRVIDVYLGA
ncbi:MAG: branched-chain amino acid transport system ATP-binding protein [Actinomycetota bacterium]|nr:branched-chain amino acid transport system ATP-binding protein [Actinomycetota bacterium]